MEQVDRDCNRLIHVIPEKDRSALTNLCFEVSTPQRQLLTRSLRLAPNHDLSSS